MSLKKNFGMFISHATYGFKVFFVLVELNFFPLELLIPLNILLFMPTCALCQ